MLKRARVLRVVKFGIVGVSGTLVNLAISEFFFRIMLADLEPDHVRLACSQAVGWTVSVFTNFLLNDSWTWGDRQKGAGSAWYRRLGKYYLAAAAAGLLQIGVSVASYELVFHELDLELWGKKLDSTLSICTGIGAGMVINFLASHFWAFKDES